MGKRVKHADKLKYKYIEESEKKAKSVRKKQG